MKVQQALEKIDLNKIKASNTTFIEEAFKEKRSDVLFECTIKRKKAYVYLLIEHQSTASEDLPFRLLKYIWGVIENHCHLHKTSKLPTVYPLIFYNGAQSPYSFSLDIFDYFDDPLNVMRSVLFNPIKLIDVKSFPPDKLNEFTWFHSMVEAMKHIRSTNITPHLPAILAKYKLIVSTQHGKKYVEFLLNYVIKSGHVTNLKSFQKTIAQVSPEAEEMAMNLANQLLKQGREEGRQEGKQEGRQLGIKEGEQLGIKKGEQLGIKKGEQLGLKKGTQLGLLKGKQEGKTLGERTLLVYILQQKFDLNPLPDWALTTIENATSTKIKKWSVDERKSRSLKAFLK